MVNAALKRRFISHRIRTPQLRIHAAGPVHADRAVDSRKEIFYRNSIVGSNCRHPAKNSSVSGTNCRTIRTIHSRLTNRIRSDQSCSPSAPGWHAEATSAHDEWWDHRPSGAPIEVRSATIDLPFLRAARRATLPGGPAAKLEAYRREAPFDVSEATIAEAETSFALPPRLR